MPFAREFKEIAAALAQEDALRIRVINLVRSRPILGRAVEGPGRADELRSILELLAAGRITVGEAGAQTQQRLPRASSPYASDNRVFASDWADRLIRVQFSRFYNQAVLEQLSEAAVVDCVVAHATEEQPGGTCAQNVAGRRLPVAELLSNLVAAYEQDAWDERIRVPRGPHCHHVVSPGR